MSSLRMEGTPVLPMPTECPRCRAKLDTGFLLAPRGLYWDRRVHWSIIGAESILTMWDSLKMPNVPASRCRSCNLMLFGFE